MALPAVVVKDSLVGQRTPGGPNRHRLAQLSRDALAVVLLSAVVIGLQVAGGAFRAEFSAPDEPSHFVTGLMIHDYIRAGFPSPPMAYATTYYIHYPKVAFGHWPPLFHVIEAAWLMILPTSRISVLLLIAAIAALLAATLYRAARQQWGTTAGVVAAIMLVMLPVSQYLTNRVTVDGLVALLGFWTALRWARYLDDGKPRDAVLAGIIGGLGLLAKGNGIAFLVVPFVSVVVARRWTLLKRRSFWYAPALMFVIGMPFQVLTAVLLRSSNTLVSSPATYFVEYTKLLATHTGIVGPFAVVGLAALCAERGRISGFWASMVALACSVFAFHVMVPLTPESRYLFPMLPVAVLLAGHGMDWITRRQRIRHVRRWQKAAILTALALFFVLRQFHVPAKRHYGYDDVANFLFSQENCGKNCVIVTSSQGGGDGMLVSEVAILDHRVGRFVLRADKILGRSNWDGHLYESLYHSAHEVDAYLVNAGAQYVVVDTESTEFDLAHHQLLLAAMSHYPQHWSLVYSYPAPTAGLSNRPAIVVYRSLVARPSTTPPITLDMTFSLGRTISLK